MPTVDPLSTASMRFLYVDDADALHAEWESAVVHDPATGSRLERPMDTEYGLREFALVDPSGNLVSRSRCNGRLSAASGPLLIAPVISVSSGGA